MLINGSPYTKNDESKGKAIPDRRSSSAALEQEKLIIWRPGWKNPELLEQGLREKGRKSEFMGPSSTAFAPQGMDSIEPARKEGIDALGLERSVDEDASTYETILADSKNFNRRKERPQRRLAQEKEVNDQLKKKPSRSGIR